MSQAKTSTQVLKAARWMLDQVGWIQGKAYETYDDKITGFCLSGAIGYVNTDIGASMRAMNRLRLVLPKGHSIASFNDDPKTTKRKVLSLINRALKKGVKK